MLAFQKILDATNNLDLEASALAYRLLPLGIMANPKVLLWYRTFL